MTQLKSYHFSLGNSGSGPIGFAARIRARDKAEAIRILNTVLPESVTIYDNLYDEDGAGIEYITVYFGMKPLTPKTAIMADSPAIIWGELEPGDADFTDPSFWPSEKEAVTR
jgi:hypothetical protein